MQNPPELEPPSDTWLYVRWGADRSRYALEIKLELIGKLRRVLSETDNKSTEIGGVLLGSLPTPNAATLRIEDVELIARDPADGATFMLDPRQGDRFAEVRRRARERGKAAVGLFRSHIRAGALRPSIADRTLLHDKFEQGTYSLLLVQGSLPFQAAVFIADNGQLPAEPSVREFNLDEQDFRNLPEIEPEQPAKPVPDKPVPEQPVPGQKNYRTLGLVFLALLVCGIVIWALTGREGFGSRLGATNEIQL